MHDRYFRTVYRLSEGRINDLRETVWCAAGLDLTLAGCFWSWAAWSGAGRFGWLTVLLDALPAMLRLGRAVENTGVLTFNKHGLRCDRDGRERSANKLSEEQIRVIEEVVDSLTRPEPEATTSGAIYRICKSPRPRRVIQFLPFLLSSIFPFTPRRSPSPPVPPFLYTQRGWLYACPPPGR